MRRLWTLAFVLAAIGVARLGWAESWPYTNGSGGTITSGQIVVIDSAADKSITTTTSAGVQTIVGVAAWNPGYQSVTYAAGGLVDVQVSGITKVTCMNAVSRGDFIVTGTVAGQGTAQATEPTAWVGRALTADAAAPYEVEIELNPQLNTGQGLIPIDLESEVAGTLPIANGGTGNTTGDAATVDGFSASGTPGANQLVALNGSSRMPANTVDSSSIVDGQVGDADLATNAVNLSGTKVTGTAPTSKGGTGQNNSAATGFQHYDAGTGEVVKSNFTATVDPTSTDDSAAGYAKGSFWLNNTTKKLWVCVDPAATAAVWKDATASAGGTHPVDLASDVTGTLPIANGGTGNTTGDAATVDGFSASGTPGANQLVALSGSSRMPANTVDSSSIMDGEVSTGDLADRGVTQAKLGFGVVYDATGGDLTIDYTDIPWYVDDGTSSSVGTVTGSTIAVAASATNYVQFNFVTPGVEVNQTGFQQGKWPLATVVTNATEPTSITLRNTGEARKTQDGTSAGAGITTVQEDGVNKDTGATKLNFVEDFTIGTATTGEPTAQLKDGAVDTAEIANGAVTDAKLSADSVTTAKVAGGAVTTDKIADGRVSDETTGDLTVDVAGGTFKASDGSIFTLTATTLGLAASQTNYVFCNTAAATKAYQSNTTGFPATNAVELATVVTDATQITTINGKRVLLGGASSGGGATLPRMGDLVLYAKLDEASGSRALTYGQNGPLGDNGTVAQGASLGIETNSADFTPANSEYLSLSNANWAGQQPYNEFELMFAFRADTLSDTRVLASMWNASTNQVWSIQIGPTGVLGWYTSHDGSTAGVRVETASSYVVTGTTYLVAAGFDGKHLYVHSFKVGTDSSAQAVGTESLWNSAQLPTTGFYYGGNARLLIGARDNAGTPEKFFDGRMEWFSVWNKAHTLQWHTWAFNGGSGRLWGSFN